MGFETDKHIAYDGRAFRIEWYVDKVGQSPALEYAENEIPKSHKSKLLHLFKVMGDQGKIHDIRKFRHEGDGIYAFKPQPYRFLSFFTKGKKIIITNAFYKDEDKLPKAEKDRALKARNDYEAKTKRGDYYD